MALICDNCEVAGVFQRLKKRLFFWKRTGDRLQDLSAERLRRIKQEADYLSAAVESTNGLLRPEDMERLKALTRTLGDVNKLTKSE